MSQRSDRVIYSNEPPLNFNTARDDADLGKKGVQVGAGIVGKPPAPKDMTHQTGKRLNPHFTDPSQDWAPGTEQ